MAQICSEKLKLFKLIYLKVQKILNVYQMGQFSYLFTPVAAEQVNNMLSNVWICNIWIYVILKILTQRTNLVFFSTATLSSLSYSDSLMTVLCCYVIIFLLKICLNEVKKYNLIAITCHTFLIQYQQYVCLCFYQVDTTQQMLLIPHSPF